jgi:hypothetical protein
MCLPQWLVVPPIPHRVISMRKPPPFTSNWNVSKSTCVTCSRLRCGYDPVNPLSRSADTTEVFRAKSIQARGDSIECLTNIYQTQITHSLPCFQISNSFERSASRRHSSPASRTGLPPCPSFMNSQSQAKPFLVPLTLSTSLPSSTPTPEFARAICEYPRMVTCDRIGQCCGI